MNPLQSLPEYEHFIYTLPQRYPTIRRSTLTVIRRGTATAVLTGEVELGSYRIVVREKLSFSQTPGVIKGYGYEVWKGEDKLCWYDSQPPPMTCPSPVLTPTTNTSLLTSNIIASQPPT